MNTKLRPEEMNRMDVDSFKNSDKFHVIVILDNIRSGNNIGSVFRSSDALRTDGVYICGISAKPPHKDIHKTALGSTETVKWEYFERTMEAVQKAKSEGYKVYALEQAHGSIMLDEFLPNKKDKIAVVVGNEVRGVEQEVIDSCDEVLEIPQFGTKHSFNVSVSTGIILWDLYTKMNPFN